MDYIDNYAQIGGYGTSMPAPQLFYPEVCKIYIRWIDQYNVIISIRR